MNTAARPLNANAAGSARRLLLKGRLRLVLILAIAVALTVTMITAKNQSSSRPRPTILVPLYIYPAPGAWDPLFESLSNNTRLHFTVVVNPHSGPGPQPAPDSNYTRELTKLNSYANAKIVGYVSTSYANRNLSLVLQDVARYKEWDASYGVDGIFFDETPSVYDPTSAQFMQIIAAEVKNASQGFGSDPLVIFNPGTVPDTRYVLGSSPSPDITVVFEASYETYMQHQVASAIAGMHAHPSRLATILHSLPADMTAGQRATLVQQLATWCWTLFVTDQDSDLYTGFDEAWGDFVRTVASA